MVKDRADPEVRRASLIVCAAKRGKSNRRRGRAIVLLAALCHLLKHGLPSNGFPPITLCFFLSSLAATMQRPTALEVDISAASSTISLEVAPAYDSPVFFNPVDFKKSTDAISPISSTHSSDVESSHQSDETTTTTNNNGPAPSVRLLFSLVSRRHCFLLLLPAFISSVVAGGIAPFMTFVIGQSFDAFASFPLTPNPPQSAKTALLHRMGLAALELVGLAIGSLLLSSVTSCLWIWTGEHNAMSLRKKVYAAVTQKDMVWFDTKMGAEGNVTSAEDEQGPMGAGGLMAKFTRYAQPVALFVLYI